MITSRPKTSRVWIQSFSLLRRRRQKKREERKRKKRTNASEPRQSHVRLLLLLLLVVVVSGQRLSNTRDRGCSFFVMMIDSQGGAFSKRPNILYSKRPKGRFLYGSRRSHTLDLFFKNIRVIGEGSQVVRGAIHECSQYIGCSLMGVALSVG